MEENVCQNCNYFKQPKCTVKNEFKARKTKACGEFKSNKKKNIKSIKKIEKPKTEEEIKKEILGGDIDTPDRPKMKRSKTQRRK